MNKVIVESISAALHFTSDCDPESSGSLLAELHLKIEEVTVQQTFLIHLLYLDFCSCPLHIKRMIQKSCWKSLVLSHHQLILGWLSSFLLVSFSSLAVLRFLQVQMTDIEHWKRHRGPSGTTNRTHQ